ncbi:MAG: helix-turn-helix domain-containing protein [Pseudomonadota bacterium]
METGGTTHQLQRYAQRYPLDAFQADLVDICGSFDVRGKTARQDSLAGHLSVAHFGGLDVAHVGLDAEEVTRKSRNIRRDPGNHFFLIIQQQGRAQLIQNDVSSWAEPGDMFVVDSTKESSFRYQSRYSLQLSVHLPREEACHRFGRRIYGGLAIDGGDPLALAMKAVLAKLIASTEPGAQTHTVEAFFSVFGALLTERALGNGRSVNPDRQLVQTALALIAEHYQEPGFTSLALAARVGVPLRRLQRAFKIIGETPHDRLQRYRVEAVHLSLQAAAQGDNPVTITRLAYAAGFSELSTFYRLYRKHYGCAPGQNRPALLPDASCKAF